MTLTYEQCLELKEAGFPQELKYGDGFYPIHESRNTRVITLHGSEHAYRCGPGRCGCECTYCYPYACKNGLKIPTLEELIDACGEHLSELGRLGEDGLFKWYAEENNRELTRHYAATPSEAIANLWLALQKKEITSLEK